MDVLRKQRAKQPCAMKCSHSCGEEYNPEYIKFGFIMVGSDAERRALCVKFVFSSPFTFLNSPSTAHKSALVSCINKPVMKMEFFNFQPMLNLFPHHLCKGFG